jgi:hypothetical protein
MCLLLGTYIATYKGAVVGKVPRFLLWLDHAAPKLGSDVPMSLLGQFRS